MLRMALVGVGRWGSRLVESVQGKSDRVRFVAAATRDPSRHREFAERFGVTLTSFDAVLADDSIDAIHLATPHSMHHDQVLAVAAAGKHVLVEKPLTLTRASAESAIAACHAAGVKIGHGYNRRYLPALAEITGRLGRGDLGQLLHVDAQFSGPTGLQLKPEMWRSNRAECPAGGMTPRGIHALDYLIHFAGPVASVFAHSDRRVVAVDIDDVTSALLKFANGTTGYLASHFATAELWRVQFFGSKGWLEMRGENELIFQPISGDAEHVQLPAVDKERAELEAFADHVAGIAAFPVTDAEAINGIAVLEALTKSAESGQPVSTG